MQKLHEFIGLPGEPSEGSRTGFSGHSAHLSSNRKAPAIRAAARSRTAVKPARASSSPKGGPSRSYSQEMVTSHFLLICGDAIRENARVYVQDHEGRFYLTLDPVKRYLHDPVIDVGARNFKDNFAGFSSLIKVGLCFRLYHGGSKPIIYARQHTRYSDPLDYVVEQWRERMASHD